MQTEIKLNTLLVNFPVPPDASMPEPLQTIMFWLTAGLALAVLAYSFVLARKHHSAIPVLLVIAGAAAIPLEPIVGFLGHVIHPADGSIKMFSAVNRTIPWHMGFAYTGAFGAVYLALYMKMVNGPVNPRYVWVTFAISVCAYILAEIYPVHAGLWVYYDNQPLWLWKGMAPLTWAFMNSACEIMGIALVYLLLPALTGWKQILVVVLGPMGALMGHLGCGWPMYSVINSSASQSPLLLELSGLLTVALAFMVIWICTAIFSRPHHTL
tara:strand:- start:21 stop:824 length:804 start_codon:yes stop_codon:yes gene_type:complete